VTVAPYIVAVWVLFVGLYGVVTSRHLIHLVICLSVAQSSTYLILLGIGFHKGYVAPVFADVPL
jgi:multicomponent Na+:H+ antiporter subunit C